MQDSSWGGELLSDLPLGLLQGPTRNEDRIVDLWPQAPWTEVDTAASRTTLAELRGEHSPSLQRLEGVSLTSCLIFDICICPEL